MEINNENREQRKEAPFEIWIGNLASYVAGKLEGEWVTLPQSEDKLKETINQISRNGEDEIMIMDYSFREDCMYLNNCFGEWSNVTDLNIIAKLIGVEEHPNVEAYIETNGNVTLSELANLFMQEEEITFYPYEFEGSDNPEVMDRLSNEEKMGYTIIERNVELKRLLENTMLPTGNGSVMDYIDVTNIGRDYSYSGYATLFDNGYYEMSGSGPDLGYYTMEEISEEFAEKERRKEETEQELQKEEEKKELIQKKPEQQLKEKAPSI